METQMDRTLNLLKKMVTLSGGKIIVASGHAVGFRDTDNELRKLFAKGDLVFLEQVSGPERGKRAEVDTLSVLLAKDRELS